MGFPESARAAVKAGFDELRHVEVTGSTNDDLADEAKRGIVDPVVLVADHQEAGRGRRDREWVDDGESLLVSFRLQASVESAHQVMNAVAAAARHVIDSHIDQKLLFKWPNDLVVMSNGVAHKLAGTLAEWIDSEPPVVIVGIGINVGPVSTDQPAMSIRQAGGSVDRDQLLAEMLTALPPRLADAALVRHEMLAYNATLGLRVRIQLPAGRSVVGVASNLGVDGHLVVIDDADESHDVSVGDVVHLRPTNSD